MIKNIIFDVGGVLIGYRWKEMLMDYGLSDEMAEKVGMTVFSDLTWSQVYDAGKCTTAELKAYYMSTYPDIAEHIEYFIDYAQLMRIKLPEVWELVEELKKKGYGLYILSNYSEDLFKRHTEGCDFLEMMDGKVVSYEVKVVKPNKRIYEIILDKYDLQAEECLFFDDRAENVKAAESCGIQGKTVVSTEYLIEELKKLI